MIIGHLPCSDRQMLTFSSLGCFSPTLVPGSGGMLLSGPLGQAAFDRSPELLQHSHLHANRYRLHEENGEGERDCFWLGFFFFFFRHTLNQTLNKKLILIQEGRPCTSATCCTLHHLCPMENAWEEANLPNTASNIFFIESGGLGTPQTAQRLPAPTHHGNPWGRLLWALSG